MGTTPTDVDYLAGQPGPGYGDSIGGMTIAGGIMGALFHRERTGEAVPLDVSLLGVGMWAMSPAMALSLQLNMPWRPGPSRGGGAGPANPLVGTYRTEDGRFLAFSCLQGFKYWPSACRSVGPRRPHRGRALQLARAVDGQCRCGARDPAERSSPRHP